MTLIHTLAELRRVGRSLEQDVRRALAPPPTPVSVLAPAPIPETTLQGPGVPPYLPIGPAALAAFQIGPGSPEGVIPASPGSVWLQTDNPLGYVLWEKQTGVGSAGWALIAAGSTAMLDTNYADGDGTAGGCLLVYSQIAGDGRLAGDVADTVLVARKSRLGGIDFDIHLVPETVAGVRGTGVIFLDTNVKVSDFSAAPFRGHGLQITQQDNSVVLEFPIAGGVILLPGTLQGTNGANLNLLVQTGGAAGSFIVQAHTGAQLLALDEATETLAVTGPITATSLSVTDTVESGTSVTAGSSVAAGTRLLDTVVGLVWEAAITVNAAAGNQQRVVATDVATEAVFQDPTNPPIGTYSQDLYIELYNGAGGPLDVPPTFGAAYVLNGAVGNPGADTEILYHFRWNSGRAQWIEVGSHSATGL